MTNQLEQLKAMRAEAQKKIEQSAEYLIIQGLDPLIQQLEAFGQNAALSKLEPQAIAEKIETSQPHSASDSNSKINNIASIPEAKSNDIEIELQADKASSISSHALPDSANNQEPVNYAHSDTIAENDDDDESLAETLRRLSQSLEGNTA